MAPEISVIIPSYNSEPYLIDALDSVSFQTLSKREYEVIIVDDFSIDGSIKIVEDWARGRSNASIIKNSKNLGVAVSRNIAIEASRSYYVALLDADDALVPGALEKSLKFFEDNPQVKYSYSQHSRMTNDGKFICNRLSQEFSMNDLFHYNFISPLKCFERGLHDKIGGFNPRVYAEDWDHIIRAAIELKKGEIKRNSEVLYKYRWYSSNTSNAKVDELKVSVPKFLRKHLKSVGIEAKDIRHSHITDRGYNYYDWEENGKTTSNSK